MPYELLLKKKNMTNFTIIIDHYISFVLSCGGLELLLDFQKIILSCGLLVGGGFDFAGSFVLSCTNLIENNLSMFILLTSIVVLPFALVLASKVAEAILKWAPTFTALSAGVTAASTVYRTAKLDWEKKEKEYNAQQKATQAVTTHNLEKSTEALKKTQEAAKKAKNDLDQSKKLLAKAEAMMKEFEAAEEADKAAKKADKPSGDNTGGTDKGK